MNKTLNSMLQIQSEEDENRSMVIPSSNLVLSGSSDGYQKKDHSWLATSNIPTDLSIQVEDITFNVHKYPLVSRCGYLSRIEFQPPNTNLGYDLKLESFPGGPETFETVLKFCYGLPVSLNPENVAALRCASEFLEMTEALEDGNLISKTEAFFTFVVLTSWRDTITVIKSCENLSPWAENLQFVRRCCDSLAWKVSREDEVNNDKNWWIDDSTTLRIDHFVRIVTAVRAKGMKPETIGSCIVEYWEKWLPSMDYDEERFGRNNTREKSEMQWNITSGKKQEVNTGQEKEVRMIIESLVSILPPQKEAISCRFLLRMLKMAMMYSASPALVSELEKKIGLVLENATVNDLLIPNNIVGDQGKLINPNGEQNMYNTDMVLRIIEYSQMYEQRYQQQQSSGTLTIGKLLDSYLAQIARDPSLSVTKFQILADSLPQNARICDDGLYRAIDTYLKDHPSLPEHDRRRLCKVMNCEKLSLDACLHAAQNDRLPLRTVIQVLFSEQIKLRAAIQGKDHITNEENSDQENTWSSTKKEVQILKAELENLKTQMIELQTDYKELQEDYEKLSHKHKNVPGWTIRWAKIKKSGIFHRKHDLENINEVQERPSLQERPTPTPGRKTRRQSIS